MTKETTIKTLQLENGQALEILDGSRKISADAHCVVLLARMTVPVDASLFSEKDLQYVSIDNIQAVLGKQAEYEYRCERNFIMDTDKDSVFKNLQETFFKTLLGYLASPNFPKKLILKKYKEKMKSRY